MNWILTTTLEEVTEPPKGAVGFVYCITNTSNNKKYIGRKIFYTRRKKNLTKKELSTVTDKRKKTYKHVVQESNWKTYTGSNIELNDDIKQNNPLLKKEILQICYTKKSLNYWEVFYLFKFDVLRNDSYYNSNIQGKFFRKDLE